MTVTSYHDWRAGFDWNLPGQLNMAREVCDDWAARDPDRVAIVDAQSGAHITYGVLRQMADTLAQHLREKGVGRGDRVGVLRAQHAWTAAAHIAVWKLGAISIPLFVLFGEQALESRLSDAGAVAVITDAHGAVRLGALALPELAHVVVPDDLPVARDVFETVSTGPEDPAVLIYTSGTTGGPKGALHGHRILRGHLPGVEMSHDLLPQPGDRLWTPADWAWIGGLFDVLMPALWHGVPVVAARFAKFSGAQAAELIARHKVRNVFFPPTALKLLKAEGVRLSGLRSVASGGEPLGAEILAWGRAALGVTINEFYGQTECNMTVSACGALFEAVPGAMGRAVPGHDVQVIDAVDGIGDIAVRRGSAAMMLGYWNNPQASEAKFRGEWMLTGDRGMQEGETLRFVGRDDDVISSAGYRIGPAEIEDCLLGHPAVASAGVVGKPDATRTQIVCAFVVLKPGAVASVQALQMHVKTRLAAYEYPREVHFVESLPMTVTGKVMRRELRAMLEQMP
ncbi:MAG: acetyl-CoA synthetase [Paracoccaceae bacterium]|jgi:acetyl-CoA synthetase